MSESDIQVVGVVAILVAVGSYLYAKKAPMQHPPGTIFDGYGWVKPGAPYEVTWGGK